VRLLYAREDGSIHDDPKWGATGRLGFQPVKAAEVERWIPLPEGSQLFYLPGRRPWGIDPKGQLRLYERGYAVAAFVAPAHTQLALASYVREPEAPTLPLHAYTAVAWHKGRFYVAATRVDPSPRQDIWTYDFDKMERGKETLLRRFPDNRLVAHLMENCVDRYCCPAARNLALGRWECPLPTSPACNAACIGCISLQEPHESPIPSTQQRLTFRPTAEEIAELAIHHLRTAPDPIVSFGQGCEGEPLLVWKTIAEAVQLIRKATARGIINVNTNGAWPDAIAALSEAGVDSFRISLNSAQPDWYHRYYRPRNYTFDMVVESIQQAVRLGKWVSINYFTLPGFTDQPAEIQALHHLLRQTRLHMIQWRNFNIDPDWYAQRMNISPDSLQKPYGILRLMRTLRQTFPYLTYGYFNPPKWLILRRKPLAPQLA